MDSLIRKKIKGNEYFYVVEVKRVKGKKNPRYTNQKYIGPVDKVLAQLRNMTNDAPPDPICSIVLQFGAVTALYDLALRLNVVGRLDACIDKRRQGLSPGKYLLIAALNRAVAPTSKVRIGKWFEGTILSRLMGVDPKSLSAQRFWDNMDIIDQAALERFEEGFVKQLTQVYRLQTRCLIYDATNFFTYIDTANRAELPQRGHSKEKRSDLRIVSLALMVSPDYNIPLVYEAYPGNRPDAVEFSQILDRLRRRYSQITGQPPDMTLVFDKGNNSPDNISRFSEGGLSLHFVGSLRLGQVKDMLSIPGPEYRQLEGFVGTKAYRKHLKLYGRELTVLAVYNQALYDSQMEGVNHNIAKCAERLEDLRVSLYRREIGTVLKGRKPTLASVKKEVEAILSVEYMADVFNVNVKANSNNDIVLEYVYDPAKLKEIQDTRLGKTILFTDREEWSDEEIVGAYRSAYHVEAAFRQMKNTDFLDFRPIRHWTDQKIRVHAFYCVLAYRLCCIMQKELADKGVTSPSIPAMLEALSEIKQVINIYPPKGRQRSNPVSYALTQMDEESKRMFDALGLTKYQLVR